MESVAELRGSVTLSGRFRIGDLLKVGDEDETSPSSVVVGGAADGRTLLDVIRDEEAANGEVLGAHSGNGIHWKTFKHLLRRAGASWAVGICSSSSEPSFLVSVLVPVPAAPSTSLQEGHQSGRGGAAEPPAPGTTAVDERVSLMALLEETEVHWSRREGTLPPPATLAEALAEEEKEEEEEEEGEEEKGHGTTLCMCCSVCMVRRRGAAFIPCGHTFCRLCSRKLWASRSNCPLCNGFILEILNIF